MPILYNFYGKASWLTPVFDSNGFLQNYFIVSAANPEIAAYASTLYEALRAYKTAFKRATAQSTAHLSKKRKKRLARSNECSRKRQVIIQPSHSY